MREVAALIRVSWLSAASYRTGMLMSIASLVVLVVPVYFVTQALQPVMADSIQAQGGEYFAFVVVGLVAAQFLTASVHTLPGALERGIRDGTLEALLSTRTALPKLLAGMIGYPLIWAALRVLVLLTVGLALGMHVAWSQSLVAASILVLIVLAYLPFGLVGAAMLLAVRTTGRVPDGVLVLSGFLGGVYYPTHVIPSWLQNVSAFLPLTYGLRALRQTLLEGLPLRAVLPDVLVLVAFVVLLFLVGAFAFRQALRYARKTGTLAQY